MFNIDYVIFPKYHSRRVCLDQRTIKVKVIVFLIFQVTISPFRVGNSEYSIKIIIFCN